MVNTRIYPTPSTTKYYIRQSEAGEAALVDDMFRVDFQRRVAHQPIYGYNSRKFDFVAQGKELVTGNLVINFRYPAYLYNLIAIAQIEKQINDAAAAKALGNPSTHQFGKLAGMLDVDPASAFATLEEMDNTDDKLKFLSNILINEPIHQGPSRRTVLTSQGWQSDWAPNERPQYFSSISNLSENFSNPVLPSHYSQGPDVAPGMKNSVFQLALLVKNMYKRKFAHQENPPTNDDGPLDQALFDSNSGFDLIVKYMPDSSLSPLSATFTRVFRDCYLTGEEETVSATAGVGNDLSSSAQPILEIYPFFCKTIVTEPR